MLFNCLIGLFKVTLVSLVAYLLSRVNLLRSPSNSARISGLGIALVVLVSVSAFVPVPLQGWWPRLPDSLSTQHRLRSDSGTPGAGMRLEDRIESSAPLPSVGFGMAGMDALRKRIEFLAATEAMVPRHAVVVMGGILLAVAAGMIIRMSIGVHAVWRLRRFSQSLASVVDVARLHTLCKNSGMRRKLELRQSEMIDSPCVSWMNRDIVYVPVGFEGWSRSERDAALAHELAHLVRGDAISRLLASIVAAVFWFHPLVLVLRRQLVFAQELAADRQAASYLASPADYRRGLLRLTLRTDTSRQPQGVQLVSVHSHYMIRRITMLLKTDFFVSHRTGWLQSLATGVMVAFGVFIASLSAAEPPSDRVAALPRSANSVEESVPFSAATTQPWETVGAGQGYVVCRIASLAKHPSFDAMQRFFTEEFVGDAASDEIGLKPANAAMLQTRMLLTVKELPEAQRTTDDRYMMTLTMDAFDLECIDAVDWQQASEEINFAMFAPLESEHVKLARSVMAEQGVSSRLRLVPTKAKEVSSQLLRRLKATWTEHVDGGTLAVVTAFPADLFGATGFPSEPDEDQYKVAEILKSIEIIGVGMDVSDSSVTRIPVRMALCPGEGHAAEEVAQSVIRTRTRVVESLRRSNSNGKTSSLDGLADVVESLTVEVVDATGDAPPTVLIHGRIDDATLSVFFQTM